VAGDLPGLKSSGALFIGVLRSQTSQDRIIDQFDLRKIYGKQLVIDARTKLDENTSISEDRKSGIITISVTDHSPQRAAAIANAYVDELNSLVSKVSTSSAHRERVFLEERLQVAKQIWTMRPTNSRSFPARTIRWTSRPKEKPCSTPREQLQGR